MIIYIGNIEFLTANRAFSFADLPPFVATDGVNPAFTSAFEYEMIWYGFAFETY